ncbi:MAG: RNA methyltransferase [Anaerolineae bacterium]|nr:MAG: RNA methyltransferase [Anaerolineae bacterium]
MTYYAQTMPGVEEIAWLEIRDRLPNAVFQRYLFAKEQNGIVVFDYPGPAADLLKLRTTEDVFMQIAFHDDLTRLRRDLRGIHDLIATSDSFGRAVNDYLRVRRFSTPPTYRVISRQYGKFEYSRKDLTATVWRSLKQRYPRWTPVADDAQVEFWANLLGSTFLLGARLSDRTMRHRFERKVELPAALRPSVAAAMVFLTNPQPGDVFLDPMAGSGTILYERMQAGKFARLLGGDIDQERVDAARKNVRGSRKKPGPGDPQPDIRQWDARKLPLEDASIDKIATNLPFGKQLRGAQTPAKLYPPVLAELQRVVRPGGRIVLLTSEYDLIKEEVRELPRLTITTGYSVAVLGVWGRIYIIDVT